MKRETPKKPPVVTSPSTRAARRCLTGTFWPQELGVKSAYVLKSDVSSDMEATLSICFSADMDVWIMIDPWQQPVCLKTRPSRSRISKAVRVLITAIQQENASSVRGKLFDGEVEIIESRELHALLESPHGNLTREQDFVCQVQHDDTDGEDTGFLTLTAQRNGDIRMMVDQRPCRSLRFRTMFGGGSHLIVRNALLLLALAIHLEENHTPFKDYDPDQLMFWEL